VLCCAVLCCKHACTASRLRRLRQCSQEDGWNAVEVSKSRNCWVRDIHTINADSSVLVNGTLAAALYEDRPPQGNPGLPGVKYSTPATQQ
jgi:hypothetical protein